jgi:hypothetical protein
MISGGTIPPNFVQLGLETAELAVLAPDNAQPRTMMIDPLREDEPGKSGFWRYRRIADRRNFVEGTYKGDICLVNWPQNDLLAGELDRRARSRGTKTPARAKQLSLSFSTGCRQKLPALTVARDGQVCGCARISLEPKTALPSYIRESRRIKAEFTVLEQHVGTEARIQLTGKSQRRVTAERFPDSVGIGSYRIDLHPSSGGDNYIDVSSLPFQIPLGSLIPQRVENLLPGCKNMGVTHITNGCYRLHPVEWNFGESAGLLAAFALQRKITPRQVRNQKPLLSDFQKFVQDQGVETAWPRLTPR